MPRQRAGQANEAFARIGQARLPVQPGSDGHFAIFPSEDPLAGRSSEAAVISAALLPQPYLSDSEEPLTTGEESHLRTCETALESLRVAFWAAGKALQVIRDARLYRDTHATFEDYARDRWDMSRPQAYRLIDAWPLAEQLSPMGDRLNERQVRELLPLADRHGPEAAVTVYRVVTETEGVQPTAAILHDAVSLLPADNFDAAAAVDQIRAYLAGTSVSPPIQSSDPLRLLSEAAAKLLRSWQREAAKRKVKAALAKDPEAARRVIANLREALNEIEQSLGNPGSN